MIDLKQAKEIALANVVSPTTEYFYRYLCRWYSKTFHTPLHIVFTKISPQDLAITYFEENYELMEEKDRFEDIMRAIDPDYDEKEDESIDKFIKSLEEEAKSKSEAQSDLKSKSEAQTSTPIKEPVVRTYEIDNDDESGDL